MQTNGVIDSNGSGPALMALCTPMSSTRNRPAGDGGNYAPLDKTTIPLYTQLERASKQISIAMATDEKHPELYEQLLDISEPHNYFLEPYAKEWQNQIVRKGGLSALPTAIEVALDHLKSSLLMGLLPEIHRAWITIDNKLFLWDYRKKQKVAECDDFDQLICGVGLVRPRPNVFKDFVQHILVVATPVEVRLIGLTFVNGDVENGDVRFHPSELRVSADNVAFSKIVGTQSGRIFMGGGDGSLHEFAYDNDSSLMQKLWIRQNCQNIDHTNSAATKFLKRSLSSIAPFYQTQSESIIDILVDHERKIVFTLSSSSRISVYDLGNSGQETILVDSVVVADDASKFCRAASTQRSTRPDGRVFANMPKAAEIASISLVHRNESAYISLVAVSTLGVRFYFTTFDVNRYRGNRVPVTTRPTILKICHIRLPPPVIQPADAPTHHVTEGIQPGVAPGKSPEHVRLAFYRQGVTLMSESVPDKYDQMVNIAQDLISRNVGSQTAVRKPILRESVSKDDFHGKIWQIVEYNSVDESIFSEKIPNKTPEQTSSKRSYDTMMNSAKSQDTPIILGELTSQFCSPQRHFLCLTNTGLYIFKKVRPIDQLHHILMKGSHQIGEAKSEIELFFRYYGTQQVCAMLFGIACNLPTDPGSFSGMQNGTVSGTNMVATGFNGLRSNDQVRAEAIRLALEYGGRAGVTDYAPSMGATNGRLVMTDDVYMSSHHDGMIMFVSRVLRPFWNVPFVGAKPTKKVASKTTANKTAPKSAVDAMDYFCVHSRSNLQSLRETLFQLKSILENTAPYSLVVSSPVTEDVQVALKSLPPSRANEMTRMLNLHSTPQNVNEKAQEKEKRSIQCFYRLLNRCIETFSLLLFAYDCPAAFRDKQLARMSIRDLVSTPEGEDASRKIADVLLRSHLNQPLKVEALVDGLRQKCSEYFSVADVWQYQGFQSLVRARNTPNRKQRELILQDTTAQFLRAAKHWKTLDSIDTLQKICDDLVTMGYFTGLVDIALACASNFPKFATEETQALALESSSGNSSEEPNTHLGRKRCYMMVLDALRVLLSGKSSGAASASEEDAALMDEWLTLSAEERGSLSKAMINRAVASTDELFHECFYSWLFRQPSYHDTLLEIRSPFIENFLKRQNDELLSNYYVRCGYYDDAALVMWNKAHLDSPQLHSNPSVTERLHSLTRCLNYAQSAVSVGRRPDTAGNRARKITSSTLNEIGEKLDILQLQAYIFAELETQTRALEKQHGRTDDIEVREKDLEILKYKLIDVSTLYNRFAQKYRQYNNCLLLLHSCNKNEPQIIRELWHNIITGAIPARSANPRVHQWLLHKNLNTSAAVESTDDLFEDGKWIGTLQNCLQPLGSQIYATGADFAFPVDYIAGLLESFWVKYLSTGAETTRSQSTWIAKLLRDINVPYGVLFDTYRQLYHETGAAQLQIHLLETLLEIISTWKNEASSSRATKEQLVEFADGCPVIVRALEEFTTDLQAMRDESGVDKSSCLVNLRQLKEQILNYRQHYF